MFAFFHLVISGVSLSCHWLVLEPPVKAISAQLDDWVSPGTDCCFAALLLGAVGALVCSAPSNVILGLSLWTEPGAAASLLCQGMKIVAGIPQGTVPIPCWLTDALLLSPGLGHKRHSAAWWSLSPEVLYSRYLSTWGHLSLQPEHKDGCCQFPAGH